MREIKFRAWDFESRSMIGSVSLMPRIYEAIYGWDTHDNQTSLKIMQYTGLKDKNGDEIYEGDIVKKQRGDYEEIQVVEWVKNSCGFEPFSDSGANCGCCGGADRPEDCEVIGNIYENPELIQNK